MLSPERRAYANAWYAQNKEKYTNYRLKARFGITLEEYNLLLQEQEGVCAICKRTEARRLAVDHCHATGQIRGLLCSGCNRLLGRIEDPKGQAAIRYLQERG
jgi:hypothetical protein